VIAAVILGLATILSAIAAHQGDMWGGSALETYHKGTVKMNEATSASLLGVQFLVIDGITYLEFVSQAHLGEQEKSQPRIDLANYIEQRIMLDDFRVALTWAKAQNGKTPFEFPGLDEGTPEHQALTAVYKELEGVDLPSYQALRFGAGEKLRKEGEELFEEGEELFEEGQEQDGTGDDFMMTTLYYTVALFFAGLAGTSKRLAIKVGFVAFGGAVMLLSFVKMMALPFMW
jgi:hypothetical protein